MFSLMYLCFLLFFLPQWFYLEFDLTFFQFNIFQVHASTNT